MDILASFLQGQQAGQQQRGYRKEQNNLAKMEALAPRIVQGDPGAYAEAAAIDPAKANAYQGANDVQVRKLKGFVDYVNGARKSGNAAAVNAALQQGAPFITQLTGKPAPTEWTPDMDAGWAQLEAQVAMLGADPAQGTLQSQKIGADGFIYNTYRDGRMVNTGIKADRQMWLRDFPGMDPQLVGKDGSILPVGQQGPQQVGAPSQAAPQRSDMEADIELANSMIAAGIPEAQVDAFLAQRGQRAGSAAVANQPVMAGVSGLARPSAAQEAAAVEAAKQATQLQYLPAELGMRTNAAIQQTVGVERAKAEIEQSADQAERNATFRLYETAMDGLRRGLEQATTGPIVGRLPAVTADAQTAQGGVAAMAPILKQLFRVAGEGTFTDSDQKLLMDMVPTRADLPAARDAKLANIDAIVRAKLRVQRTQAQGSTSQPQQSRPVMVHSPADYNALPSGALYTAPDGSTRRKK